MPALDFSDVPNEGQLPTEDQAGSILRSIAPGVTITSQQRSPLHNADVGGVPDSMHVNGQATDFVLPGGMTAEHVKAALQAQNLPVTEFLNEGNHVHWGWGPKPQAANSNQRPGGPLTFDDIPATPQTNGQKVTSPSAPITFDDVPIVKSGKAVPPPKPESSWWDTVVAKPIENFPAAMKQLAGSIEQMVGEQGPEAFAGPEELAGYRMGQALATPAQKAEQVQRQQDMAKAGAQLYASAAQDVKANMPTLNPDSAKDYVYKAANGTVQMLPILLATIATKSPALGAVLIGGQTLGSSYAPARAAGRTADQAQMDAMFSGLTTGSLSALPLGVLMKPGGTFLANTLKSAVSFGRISVLTEAMQVGYDKGLVTPDMTLKQAIDRVRDAGIVGTLQGALLGGGHAAFEGAVNRLHSTLPKAPAEPAPASATQPNPQRPDLLAKIGLPQPGVAPAPQPEAPAQVGEAPTPEPESFRTTPAQIAQEHALDVAQLERQGTEAAAAKAATRGMPVEQASHFPNEIAPSPSEASVQSAAEDIASLKGKAPEKPRDLFQFIGQQGGIRTRDAQGELTPHGAEVEAVLKDYKDPRFTPRDQRLIGGQNGISPDVLRETMQDKGWFGPEAMDKHGPNATETGTYEGDDIQDFYDKLARHVNFGDVVHPDDFELAQDVAQRKDLRGQLDQAGVGSKDSPEVAAQKLAEWQQEQTNALEHWRARATGVGVPVEPDMTAEELMADSFEREAIRAEQNGESEKFADDAEQHILDHMELDHSWEAQHDLIHELEIEPEPRASERADEEGARAGPVASRATEVRGTGASAEGGGAGAGGSLGLGEEETPAEIAARAGRKTIEESQQLPRANSGKVQKEANEGLFAPPPAASADLLTMAKAGEWTPETGALYLPEITDAVVRLTDNVQMLASPMTQGSMETKAAAKDFANLMAAARWHGNRMMQSLKTFKPDQLQRMWEAADQESVNQQRAKAGKPPIVDGMAALTDEERASVQSLQADAQSVWNAARESGMVKGEGLPSYVPRLLAEMGLTGDPKGIRSVPGIGNNLRTTTSSLLGRKHLTTEETEAAASAKTGTNAQVVKDIRTLPLVTMRLREAIAGRQLINAVKEIGKAGGEDVVSEGREPNDPQHSWFTMNHPAFRTWRPKFVTDEESGKTVQMQDQNGNPVFERAPIYVRSDFEGPLRAVLSQDNGAIYNGLMKFKGKVMNNIMFSPLVQLHLLTELGRALPAAPLKVASLKILFDGYKAKNDPATMTEAIMHGLRPISHQGQMQDITSQATPEDIQPGRSWTAKVLGAVPYVLDPRAGTAVYRAIDKMGDFLHNTLLWDRVADLQAGLYTTLRDHLMERGDITPDTARYIAAHQANRYAGTLPVEAMSTMARKIANVVLFSRTYTMGNWGVMKDALYNGLPNDIAAQIERDGGLDQMKQARTVARRKALGMLVTDVALMYVANSLLQNAFAYWQGRDSESDIMKGYYNRLVAFGNFARAHPMAVINPFTDLARLAATATNEPDPATGQPLQRIMIGYDKNGTAQYARNPLGKYSEEVANWLAAPGETAISKLSPFVRPVFDAIANRKDQFGHKLFLPTDSDAQAAAKIAQHFVEAQLPMDQIRSATDLMQGHAKTTDAAKLLGRTVGITFRSGFPGGPQAGADYRLRSQYNEIRSDALPAVNDMIKSGDRAGAWAKLGTIGFTPSERVRYINAVQHPHITPRKREIMQKVVPQ